MFLLVVSVLVILSMIIMHTQAMINRLIKALLQILSAGVTCKKDKNNFKNRYQLMNESLSIAIGNR